MLAQRAHGVDHGGRLVFSAELGLFPAVVGAVDRDLGATAPIMLAQRAYDVDHGGRFVCSPQNWAPLLAIVGPEARVPGAVFFLADLVLHIHHAGPLVFTAELTPLLAIVGTVDRAWPWCRFRFSLRRSCFSYFFMTSILCSLQNQPLQYYWDQHKLLFSCNDRRRLSRFRGTLARLGLRHFSRRGPAGW